MSVLIRIPREYISTYSIKLKDIFDININKQNNIEEVNGRGVFIMTRLADEIKYTKKGNSVTMVFNNVID